jgi:apolipoprotein N-acyltransferase
MNSLQLQTKIFLGAISGIIIARSFYPTNTWYLIPIGIAIWWAGTHKRPLVDYLFFSFFFSIGFWFTHISWLSLVGIDAYILLSTLMSLIYGASGYLMYKVKDLRFSFAWYGLIFISVESLTDYIPFGGFPWGKISYASADATWAKLFPYGSSALVTLAILAISIMLIPSVGFILQKAFAASFVFIIAIIAFNLFLNNLNDLNVKTMGSIDLAVIQGSVPRSGLLFNEQKLEVLKYHETETNKLLKNNQDNFDAILWPENSIDVDPFKNLQAMDIVDNVLTQYQKPLIAGAVLQKNNGLSNSILLWNPENLMVEDSYQKSILVPFGEYLPYRNFLSKYIRRFDLIPQDFIPGKYANNLKIADAVISPIVCFEIAWNKTLVEQVRNGGELISVHTNNATYAFSNQVDQQFMMTRIRAMETGRQAIVTATTGISAHIDRNGEVLWESKEFVPQSKIITASLFSDLNPAIKYRNIIVLLSLSGGLFPFILLVINKMRRKI